MWGGEGRVSTLQRLPEQRSKGTCSSLTHARFTKFLKYSDAAWRVLASAAAAAVTVSRAVEKEALASRDLKVSYAVLYPAEELSREACRAAAMVASILSLRLCMYPQKTLTISLKKSSKHWTRIQFLAPLIF